MTLLGAGLMPIGTGPIGLWYDDSAVVTRPDPTPLSRWVDVSTRSYAFDQASRQLAKTKSTRQRVALTLTTLQQSSSTLPGWGITIPSKHGASFAEQMTQSVKDALRTMSEVEKSIRVDSVEVEVSGSRSRTTVTWTDLSSGKQFEEHL